MRRNEEGRGPRGEPTRQPGEEVDETLDRVVSRLGDRTPEYTERAKVFFRQTGRRLREIDDRGEEYSTRMFKSKPAELVMDTILKWRKTVFALTVVISLLIGYFGIIGTGFLQDKMGGEEVEPLMQEKIRGDFEVYLPGGSDAEKVLFEMKEDWSTDLATIFTESQNKFDPTDETNITDYAVLKEISDVEEALNYNKVDKGREDGIIFCFSISTLIKTLHNATNSVEAAILNELPSDDPNIPPIPEEYRGDYTIPEDQRLIDYLFNQIPPDKLSSLVNDNNGDGIYDSALIMMGLSKDVDQDKLIDTINEVLEPYFVDPGVRPGSKDTTDEWLERYQNGGVHSRMTLTGPTPLARMISDRTMTEMQTVLPWALAMVGASLLIFHRTWKIWLITLIPVVFSLIVAYGLMGYFLPLLTPQVVLVAPILIALGVAYGLYIANRYSEESDIEDKEKRIRVALRTTGKAIFLSAMTTAIGFGAMMTVDMATMQVLGFGLSAGILSCYATTMLMTPSLVIWTNYKKARGVKKEKKGSMSSRRLGNIPMRHSRKLLVGGILLAIFSMALSPMSEIPLVKIEVGGFGIVQANMDYIALSPADEPVVQKMDEQSRTFGSGQIGLMIIRGDAASDEDNDTRDDDVDGSIKDPALLNKVEDLMKRINGDGFTDKEGIDRAEGISIVEVMKMIQIPDFTNSSAYQSFIGRLQNFPLDLPGIIIENPVDYFDRWVRENIVGKDFWELSQRDWDTMTGSAVFYYYMKEDPSTFLMNVFYNSLGQEIRGMLINDDYSKTVIYINMPNMDIIETEKTVKEVDEAITANFRATAAKGGEKPSASPLTGFGKVLVTINEVIVNNANQSTFTALFLVFILLWFVLKSWRIAAITVLPVVIVVSWQYFAIWGVGEAGNLLSPGDSMFSGDLNLFSALIGSMIIGLGVDFAIHITERVRERNFSLEGVKYAAETSGWSFIEATTTMIMGLTAVFLVNIPSIREFILLIMILLAFSAYSAIFLLTSIYRLYLPRYNKLRRTKGKR